MVTGAGGGIGRAIALGLASEGVDVAVVGRRAEALAETARMGAGASGSVLALQGDVRDPESVTAFVERAATEFGRLDIAVTAAGNQTSEGPAAELDLAVWDEMMLTLVRGTFLVCQAAGRHFVEQGHGKIVTLASTLSFTVVPQAVVYCTTKGAVLQMTRALAAEWAPRGVNVNAIAPTGVHTEGSAQFLDDPKIRAATISRIPAGRLATGEDIVGAALYLASPASDMVHGHTLLVDGGYTLV